MRLTLVATRAMCGSPRGVGFRTLTEHAPNDRSGSHRSWLLFYDIYHMQIMEGDDVICTIRDNIEHIAHFHTGGVPGRGELDDRQEMNYRGIATAISETGFDGFVAHEFIPTGDPLTWLREAFTVYDV